MFVDLQTMKKIHEIQIEMWRELMNVMDRMGLRYYFVHGSLLGAVTIHDFIIEDDDIDIALFRKDYNRLIVEGNQYLPEKYSIQASTNDDYPLAFAKMRNKNTAFFQPVLMNYQCNQGIYIDIFPIDYVNEKKTACKLSSVHETILSLRLNSRFYGTKKSFRNKVATAFSYVVYPSFNSAVKVREKMFTLRKESLFVNITGGKPSEHGIPAEWFGDGTKILFCDCEVTCPEKAAEYLSRVYGNDYLKHNPAETRIRNSQVELSCNILDFEKSYTTYE